MSTIWDHDPETGEIIERPRPNSGEYSVTELAGALKRTLEDRFGQVRVRGEISGFRGPSASGHCYFAIKDEGAKLDAVRRNHQITPHPAAAGSLRDTCVYSIIDSEWPAVKAHLDHQLDKSRA